MRAKFENVLFVCVESRSYQDRIFHRAKFVDDQGDFSALEVTVTPEELVKLPQPRSRVNLSVELQQRNGRTYLSSPLVEVRPLTSAKVS